MSGKDCCTYVADFPADSPALNIIVDFGINIATPNSEVYYREGTLGEMLEDNIPELRDKLASLIYNTGPSAIKAYQSTKYCVFLLFLVGGLIFVDSLIYKAFDYYTVHNNDFMFHIIHEYGWVSIVAVIFVVVLVFYGVRWLFVALYNYYVTKYCKKWCKKVLPVIVDYAQNEFRQVFCPCLDIHILHPIQCQSSWMVSNWVVIRFTKGPIQKPIYAPVYWSSNGTVIQPEIPIIVHLREPEEFKEEQLKIFGHQPNEEALNDENQIEN